VFNSYREICLCREPRTKIGLILPANTRENGGSELESCVFVGALHLPVLADYSATCLVTMC
jgi:hypothetical protein